MSRPQQDQQMRPEDRVRRVQQETADLDRAIDKARQAAHRALRADSLEGAGMGGNAPEPEGPASTEVRDRGASRDGEHDAEGAT